MTEQMRDAGTADVERALRALAADDHHVRVPAHVRATVMKAWDATTRSVRPRRRARHSWWIALAGAGAVGLFVASVSVFRSRPEAPAGTAPIVAVEGPRSTPVDTPRDAEKPVAKRSARARRVPRIPSQVRSPRNDGGIVLVSDPVLDASALSMVRVRMPRSALARLGIPIADPDATGSVDLEVVVGEDGIARTIRRALPVTESDPQE
jgi:hypothetical protein